MVVVVVVAGAVVIKGARAIGEVSTVAGRIVVVVVLAGNVVVVADIKPLGKVVVVAIGNSGCKVGNINRGAVVVGARTDVVVARKAVGSAFVVVVVERRGTVVGGTFSTTVAMR